MVRWNAAFLATLLWSSVAIAQGSSGLSGPGVGVQPPGIETRDAKSLGVVANGVTATDGTISAGSNSFTSSSVNCNPVSDPGLGITIVGAGLNVTPLVTVISSCSGNAFTLAVAALSTPTAGAARWAKGTDQSTLVQNITNSLPSNTVLSFPPGLVYLGVAPTMASGVQFQGNGTTFAGAIGVSLGRFTSYYNPTGLFGNKVQVVHNQSVIYGPEDASTQFFKIFNPLRAQFNNFESVITIPSGETAQMPAILATTDDFAGSGSALSIVAQCIEEVNNGVCDPLNSVSVDSPNGLSITGVRLQTEHDFFVRNIGTPHTTVRGVLANLFDVGQRPIGTELAAFSAGVFSGSANNYDRSFYSGNGVATTAFEAGLLAPQGGQFLGYISGTALTYVSGDIPTIEQTITCNPACLANTSIASGTSPNFVVNNSQTVGSVGTPATIESYSNRTVVAGMQSQKIVVDYTDTSGATVRSCTEQANPLASGGDVLFYSSYAGRCNWQLENLAILKSQDVSGNDVNLVFIDASNRISLGNQVGGSQYAIFIGTTSTGLEVNTSGNPIFLSQPTMASSTTGASTQTFTNSPCTGLTTERWVPVGITGQTGTWYIPTCQ